MDIKEKIEALRSLMVIWGWNAAVTVGEDPHNSEYTPLRWNQREFISGFTGSAGTVIVTADHAGLWTDTRYYIQAARELEGSGIELHKMSSPECSDWIEWIAANLPAGSKVGVDGLCMSKADADRLQALLATSGSQVISKPDYLEALWPDRPGMPSDKVWIMPEKYSGRSTGEKLSWLRRELGSLGCQYMLLNCLDQIAWLLNIRSNDVAYCPFVISFAVVGPQETALFLNLDKLTDDVRAQLAADGVTVYPYSEVSPFISGLKADGKILIDPASLNYELGKAVAGRFGQELTVCGASPVDLEKSIKNTVETEGFKKAYIYDGVAQSLFYHWLENEMKAGHRVTEADAMDRQRAFREQVGGAEFLDESFETISAYGANAALPHYATIRGKDAVLEPHGLYLNDSGAHYLFGTTDITRTVPLGPCTDLEREDYTICLKAMIDLSIAYFPAGTPGCRLDAVGRRPLWNSKRNFGHGTGHGVGHVLSVHEGPQTIRQNLKDQPMVPGMITSNEPGIYREGILGVRHENMILCVDAGENEFCRWLGFETLTRTWIDTEPIIVELLDATERQWLNDFNATVQREICPLLPPATAQWLTAKTRPV